MKSYQRWLFITLILGVFVVGLGALTRLTEAGLGCPDWPGCYGFLTVPSTPEKVEVANQLYPDAPVEIDKAWYEMVHRYFAGTLGLLVLGLFIAAWRQGRAMVLPSLLLATVTFQALLGMWTVTMNLNPLIVMAHLLGGFTTVSLLWWQWLRTRRHDDYGVSVNPMRRTVKRWGMLALVVLGLQISLGGWTSTNYAAVVCTQLPLCEADWMGAYDVSAFRLIQPPHDTYQYGVLNFEQRVTIHVTHRIGAIITTLILAAYLFYLAQLGGPKRYWMWPSLALLVQVSLGINNIVSLLPLANAVAHNVMGLGLLMTLLYSVQPLLSAQVAVRSQGGLYGKV